MADKEIMAIIALSSSLEESKKAVLDCNDMLAGTEADRNGQSVNEIEEELQNS